MPNANPILEARKSLKISQTELARELGVNLSTVWRWEKGRLPISQVVSRAVEQLLEQRKVAETQQ